MVGLGVANGTKAACLPTHPHATQTAIKTQLNKIIAACLLLGCRSVLLKQVEGLSIEVGSKHMSQKEKYGVLRGGGLCNAVWREKS